MTYNRFAELCSQYTVHPAIALENEEIARALEAKDDNLVEKLLKELF